MMRDNSIENQRLAADPECSVWVSASAGTGKTSVLVSRLLRLFLSGVDPARALCLTYTNAGAVEMQDRVFRRAKSWAVMGEEGLVRELSVLLGVEEGKAAALVPAARKLFVRLVDSPVPLKIYTIHAFCESILKRFPIEAGVSPHFEVADAQEVGLLLKEAYRQLVAKLKRGKDAEAVRLLGCFDTLASGASAAEFDSIVRHIVDGRGKFAEMLDEYRGMENMEAALKKALFAGMDDVVDDFINDGDLYRRRVADLAPEPLLREFLEVLSASGAPAMKRNFRLLSEFLADRARLDGYMEIFLTAEGSVRKSFVSAELGKSCPHLLPGLGKEADRLERARRFMALSHVYRMSRAVAGLAGGLLKIYGELKSVRGVMDFSDLIEAVERLFRRPGISGWILYKMDGGVSHVLVDEAQDTSPMQWNIVDILTEQFFTTGRGLRDMKSVFFVGDRKQSIFSFQGADIALFEKYRELFRKRVERGGFPFRELPLSRSFRSCANILGLVDAVIADGARARGVVLEGEEVEHVPHRSDSAGYVELMPLAAALPREDGYFKPPVEAVEVKSPKASLSEAVAEKIRDIIARDFISGGGTLRRAGPGDIMVLAQRRSSVRYLLGKLRDAGVPTSGEDRLALGDDIIVEDLMSLLKFVVSPYDDLSLCEALKSPLWGLDDDDLFVVCHGRRASVFDSLSSMEKYLSVAEELRALVGLGGIATPFRFFSHVLDVMGRRSRFLARFGPAAADILDEFMGCCLSYDKSRMGKSLVDFLAWFSAGAIEIKRDMEQAGASVRVMTIHGAKGLEAPIVFLFDANLEDSPLSDKVLWDGSLPLYKAAGFAGLGGRLSGLIDAAKEASLQEFYRLLYVAMTRARDRLYVAGWESARGERVKSWYGCIKEALEKMPGVAGLPGGGLALGEKDVGGGAEPAVKGAPAKTPVPGFFYEHAAAAPADSGRTARSPLLPDKEGAAAARGTMVHALLERLADVPAGSREKAARGFCGDDSAVALALDILSRDEFAFIFDNKSFAEVEIVARDGGGFKTCRIDRLVFAGPDVWIVDYKSDSRVPESPPESYVRQLEGYRTAVAMVYPGRNIRAAILWTEAPKLMEIA